MPRLHVIYDPLDRVHMPSPEWIEKAQAKIAVIPLSDDPTELQMSVAVKMVAEHLLKTFHLDS